MNLAVESLVSVNQELLSEVAGMLPARLLTEVTRGLKRERKVAGGALVAGSR